LHNGAKYDSRLKIVNVETLPEGWLENRMHFNVLTSIVRGVLLFTDADVRFRPDAIRRAINSRECEAARSPDIAERCGNARFLESRC